MGCYIIKSEIIKKIPKKYYDMTSLISDEIERGIIIETKGINGYWIDIGTPSDYKMANDNFISSES